MFDTQSRTFRQAKTEPKYGHPKSQPERLQPNPIWQQLATRPGALATSGAGSTSPPIQTKLTVNRPGDVYEQEADHVADQVMRMPAPVAVQRHSAACGQENQLQRSATREEETKVQRKEAGPSPAIAPPIVHQVLNSPGQPLDADTRGFFEPRFGHDFSHVRVHTDANAAESTNAMNAVAYAVGHNLVFGKGQYSPETHAGRRLVAHELAHSIQQGPQALNNTFVQREMAAGDPEVEQEVIGAGATVQAAAQEAVDLAAPAKGKKKPKPKKPARPQHQIAVDIAKQTVTAFDGSKVFGKFDCVAGDSSHPTPKSPKGKPFHILSKHEKYHSKTYDVDMNHAMFFTNTGEALHEYDGFAPWLMLQTGKSVTDWVGSHGCVRLEKSDAKTLFDWVPEPPKKDDNKKKKDEDTTEVEVS